MKQERAVGMGVPVPVGRADWSDSHPCTHPVSPSEAAACSRAASKGSMS